MQRLHGALRYTASPIKELLATIKKDDLSVLSWLEDYPRSADETLCPATLREEEQDFARAFFSQLGTTDLEGQLRHIEQYSQMAGQSAKEAHERYERSSKAYITTGVCAGLCAGLLLL